MNICSPCSSHSPSHRPCPFMVAAKNAGERGILWWEMCAVIVVMIIPVIIMAILLQRFIAKGVLLGAVKG